MLHEKMKHYMDFKALTKKFKKLIYKNIKKVL